MLSRAPLGSEFARASIAIATSCIIIANGSWSGSYWHRCELLRQDRRRRQRSGSSTACHLAPIGTLHRCELLRQDRRRRQRHLAPSGALLLQVFVVERIVVGSSRWHRRERLLRQHRRCQHRALGSFEGIDVGEGTACTHQRMSPKLFHRGLTATIINTPKMYPWQVENAVVQTKVGGLDFAQTPNKNISQILHFALNLKCVICTCSRKDRLWHRDQ